MTIAGVSARRAVGAGQAENVTTIPTVWAQTPAMMTAILKQPVHFAASTEFQLLSQCY